MATERLIEVTVVVSAPAFADLDAVGEYIFDLIGNDEGGDEFVTGIDTYDVKVLG